MPRPLRSMDDVIREIFRRLRRLETQDRQRDTGSFGEWTIRTNNRGQLVAEHDDSGQTVVIADRG